jgi:queuine/archaeosine tRNA-ribosyltransferase
MMLGNWRSYTETCKPDFVVALTDTPFTPPPFSQRRIQKSIDRCIAWLADILRHPQLTSNRILVQMAGSTSLPARLAFSQALQEILRDKEAETVKPLQCLDDGVSGYIFDLVPLRQSLLADTPSHPPSPANLVPLLRTSLETLPTQKLRIVNTPNTPHEILHLICHVGIDLFDAQWAERAAHVGVALDFTFPVREVGQMAPRRRISGKWDLGHNLYAVNYAEDYRRLAEGFLDGLSSSSDSGEDRPTCGCIACSPKSSSTILYSSLDSLNGLSGTTFSPPLSRAYIHHLLNTHEMSSHSLLVAHNFAVVERFFENIRALLPQISSGDATDTKDKFVEEMEKFAVMYDETGVVFEEAELCRKEVDLARGKGRLAREKARVEGEEVEGS